MDNLRDRFAALDRIAVPDLWPDIDRRVTDADAVSSVHGQVTWRAERAPYRLSPVAIVVLLSLLLALVLAVVTVGSQLPNLWTSVVPSPTPSLAGPAPAGPPQPGGIAYVTDGPQRGIVLVDPSTRDARPLTPPLVEMLDRHGCARQTDLAVQQSARVDEMTWSPDGRALAFWLVVGQVGRPHVEGPTCGLFVVSSDGQTLERLLHEQAPPVRRGYSPAWAPGGLQIAVALHQSVALVPLDGSDLVDLGRPCDGCQAISIGGWSPDGSLIAAQFRDTTPDELAAYADDTTHYIAVVDVATGEWSLLWSGISHLAPAGPPTGYQLVGWLHDGRVATQSSEGVFAAQPDQPGAWVQLPFHGARDPILNPDGLGWLGLLSPDQTSDALVDDNAGDGLRVRQLTKGRIDKIADWILAYPGAWSPDGEQLAVTRGTSGELWLMEADGGNPRRLRTHGSRGPVAWQPVWSEEENER